MLEIDGLDNGSAETVLNYLHLMMKNDTRVSMAENSLPPFISKKQFGEALSYLVVHYTSQDVSASHFIVDFDIRDIRWRLNIVKGFGAESQWHITAVVLVNMPTLNNLISENRINSAASEYLLRVLKKGANVYVTGINGSGKTELTRALLQQVLLNDQERRTITIENYDEIKLHHFGNNVVSLTGARAHRSLIQQSLRMRPDLIVVDDIDSTGEHQRNLEDAIASGIQVVVTSSLNRNGSMDEQAYIFDIVITVDRGKVISIQEATTGYTRGLTLLWGIDEDTQELTNYSNLSRRLRRKFDIDSDLASFVNDVDPINRSSQLNSLTSISPEEAEEMLEYLHKLEEFFKRFTKRDK